MSLPHLKTAPLSGRVKRDSLDAERPSRQQIDRQRISRKFLCAQKSEFQEFLPPAHTEEDAKSSGGCCCSSTRMENTPGEAGGEEGGEVSSGLMLNITSPSFVSGSQSWV